FLRVERPGEERHPRVCAGAEWVQRHRVHGPVTRNQISSRPSTKSRGSRPSANESPTSGYSSKSATANADGSSVHSSTSNGPASMTARHWPRVNRLSVCKRPQRVAAIAAPSLSATNRRKSASDSRAWAQGMSTSPRLWQPEIHPHRAPNRDRGEDKTGDTVAAAYIEHGRTVQPVVPPCDLGDEPPRPGQLLVRGPLVVRRSPPRPRRHRWPEAEDPVAEAGNDPHRPPVGPGERRHGAGAPGRARSAFRW